MGKFDFGTKVANPTTANVVAGTADFQTLYWDNTLQQYLPNNVLLVDPTGMVSVGSVTSKDHTLNVQSSSVSRPIAKFLNVAGTGILIDNNGVITVATSVVISGGGTIDNTTLANGIRLITAGTNLPNVVFLDAGYFGAGIGQEQPAARMHSRSLTAGVENLRLETDDGLGTVPRINQKTFQAFARTTDATVNVTLTGGTIAIPANTSKMIRVVIIARRTGGTAGTAEDTAGYTIFGVFKNVAGVATLVGTLDVVAKEDQPAWDATLTPSGANVIIQVTGAVDNNITWYATIETNEVST